jgi:hypothetical protein
MAIAMERRRAQFVQAVHEIDTILDSKRWVSCDGLCSE